MKFPAALPPESVTAVVGTRDQLLLELSPLRVQVGTLNTGDYALAGLKQVARIERKSLNDLLDCAGCDRERFEREVQRLLSYPVKVLLVESTWADVERGEWRSKLTPEQAIGSLLGWEAAGRSIHLDGDQERAGRHAARMLFTVAKRRYRELRRLVG